jgi:hypothetical protein
LRSWSGISRIISHFLGGKGVVCLDEIDIDGLQNVICGKARTDLGNIGYYQMGELGELSGDCASVE